MTAKARAVSLEERVDALKSARGESVRIDEIGAVVVDMVASLDGADRLGQSDLRGEMGNLLAALTRAQEELTATRPRTLSVRDIPSAREELDAVVAHSEAAAGRMMDVADALGAVAADMAGEPAGKLARLCTQIFEAAGFQDIIGQRLTKVTNLLHHLETRLTALADAIGDSAVANEAQVFGADGRALDAETLKHGPQLDGKGNNQAEIDALFARLD